MCELNKCQEVFMPMLNPVFETFVEVSPITVMVGGTAERMLHPLSNWTRGLKESHTDSTLGSFSSRQCLGS
jgi:hypothetical protein